MRAVTLAAVALAVVALAGCYSPKIADNQFTCAQGGGCPSGFSCVCGSCRPDGTSGACGDMGAPGGDMSGASSGPCSNGGQRAPGDPGLSGVAVCPAAWTIPGIVSAAGRSTPCNRHPTANGRSGGTACSAEDNCGPGFHVCASEGDLMQHGFTAAHCAALGGGLWILRQQAGIPMSGGMPSGPPSCSIGEDHAIVGCGSVGMSPQSCQIVTKSVVDMPNTTTDECSTTTNGAFLCTGTGMGVFEVTVVTKPMLAQGGVLCCAN